MKKILIGAICIAVLCSCSSKKKEAEYWKGWVAMNAYGYRLQEDYKERQEDQAELAQLFSANETAVNYYDFYGTETWIEKDLTNLGSSIYDGMVDNIISSYSSSVGDRRESVFSDVIIADAVNKYLANHKESDEHGKMYYELYQELPDFVKEKYKGNSAGVYYCIDWLLNDENNLKTLQKNVGKLCGDYKDFYEFVMKSVSVIDIEKAGKRSGAKMYDVTYKISYGNSSGYALCRILINKKDSEIELVDKSENLLDLTY